MRLAAEQPSRRAVLLGGATAFLASGLPFRAWSGSPPPALPPAPAMSCPYVARGVGGGGAFIGFSMSPYQQLWFVSTDMGTLFRSVDNGNTWQAVPNQNVLSVTSLNGQDYTDLPGPGFSATQNVVFHSPSAGSPVVSTDGGVTWTAMNLGSSTVRVRFWYPDSANPGRVVAGLDDGFAITTDNGNTWTNYGSGMGQAKGCFLDSSGTVLYVAFEDGIYVSTDGGNTLAQIVQATAIHRFAGGRGGCGVVFAYVTDNTQQGAAYIGSPAGMAPAMVSQGGNLTPLIYAEHVAMAENSSCVYVTGARGSANDSGTSVWRSYGGGTFCLAFEMPVAPFGQNPWQTLTPSAVGLDIGYWDDGYFTFAVNQRNHLQVGGGELFFLHGSQDGGKTWQSLFTSPTQPQPGPGQAWATTGLANTSHRKLKFSSVDPTFGVSCGCDYSTLVTEDGGKTWRVATGMGPYGRTNLPHQSCYDVVFDPFDRNTVYGAFSDVHDFQHFGNYGRAQVGGPGGGIYKSADRGRSWTQFTDGSAAASMPFVSIEYNPANGLLYAGSQGNGLATVGLDGSAWTWMSQGFLDPNAIVVQIESDPATGDVYALLGSDPTDPSSNWLWSGLYVMPFGSEAWTQLRGTANCPAWNLREETFMIYPTSFAMVRGTSGAVASFLVSDAEICGNYLGTGLWQSTDGGNTWNRLVQYTFAYAVNLDPADPTRIYLSGLGGEWGAGGAMFSSDGGQTFQANVSMPLQYGLWSVTPDPADPTQVFYTCFGGGMYHGPKP